MLTIIKYLQLKKGAVRLADRIIMECCFNLLPRYLISLFLFFGFSVQIYSQPTFVGNWKRVKPVVKYNGVIIKIAENWGDIEFRPDSTFHIQGDTTNQNSTTPGWHFGDEYNGIWEQRNGSYLTLWLDQKEDKMFLSYKIIRITKEKLVLRSNFNKNNKQDITYLRL